MSSTKETSALSDYLTNNGDKNIVHSNHQSLIGKMLARYSSDFVVFRELIQNSDDAKAKSFQLQFICDPASDLVNVQHTHSSQLNYQRQPTGIFRSIGQFFRNRLRDTDDSSEEDCDEPIELSERKFHNKKIIEIRVVNDGANFTSTDWKRVATIAEGNTDTDAIGQFGVGFFTVFAYSDAPIIKSGQRCMKFAWNDDKSLATYFGKLPVEEQSSTTSVILTMKNKYILDTKSTTDFDMTSTDEKTDEQSENAKNKKKIILNINLTKLKAYFLKALSFTKHINEMTITIDGETVFRVKKIRKLLPPSATTLTFKESDPINSTEIFHLKSFVHAEQTYKITHGPSITLDLIDVEASVNMDKDLHDEIRHVIQKSLPSIIHIKLLFPSKTILHDKQFYTSTNDSLHTRILHSLIPLKFHDNKLIPSGQIFIGLSTRQATGIGMHVYSQLIPTIERENLDLQNPYIQIWNEEILKSIGKIARIIYDQMILDNTQDYNSIFTTYSFQPTIPEKTGLLLLDGFFSSKKDLLIPVKQTASDSHLSLISSKQAFLSNSEYLSSFLSKPLVPFDLGKNDFFKILRKYRYIKQIDHSTIINNSHQSTFLSNEFIELLQWLCSNEVNNKTYVKQVLSIVHFRETIHSPIITLNNLEFYDSFKISSDLPLPSNILPSTIASHLSREQLYKKLFLSEVPLEYLLDFYVYQKEQHKLFYEKTTSTYLLNFISQHWNQSTQNRVKVILSNLKCIPTTKGMKLPKDSYIYSTNLPHKNLPIITLNISGASEIDNSTSSKRLDHVVSIEFLKEIGCRTIYISELDGTQIDTSNFEYNRELIQTFIKTRKSISKTDFNALKESKCLIGTTLDASADKTRKYLPQDLHFPFVAKELDWPTLLILDCSDIKPYSEEYLFLKEIGVREKPDLDKLINRLVEEHQQSSMIVDEYKIPIALSFLAKNFHEYYIKFWNIEKSQRAFLPCYHPMKIFDENNSQIALLASNQVFKDESPLFVTPLREVMKLIISHFDIALIGVKQRPTLNIAFDMLMKNKNEILTTQTASKLFAYLNTLDGLNNNLVNSISSLSFIPLQDQNVFVKPTEVFIRSYNTLDQNSTHEYNETNTSGLIDYINYGTDANAFLKSVGVRDEPTAEILAELLLNRQEKYFSNLKDSGNDLSSSKLRIYTNCLKQLAAYCISTNHLHNDRLKMRLYNEPWCLGYQMVEQKDGNKLPIPKIVKPSEIYLNDDEQYFNDLQPLCVPDEPELIRLYEQFGSKWLSECVKRTLLHEDKVTRSERGNQLCDLIQKRLNLLFVNKRGERMINANEHRIEMLRKNLYVYETESIQCHLTFQNKTRTLNSTQCSSCVLEHKSDRVELYIRQSTPDLEYFDIANELARFIFEKPKEDVVDAISNRLSSSLESLKRRGMPVDRLLSINTALNTFSTMWPTGGPQCTVTKSNRVECVKLPPKKQHPAPLSKRSIVHPGEINIKPNPIPDFGESRLTVKNLISEVTISQRFIASTLFNPSHVQNQTVSVCKQIPAINLTLYKDRFHSISLYIEQKVEVTEKMIHQAEQFAYLLTGLARDVFKISIETIHLFRDIDGDAISFNINGSLFFNLRYFQQVFADEIDQMVVSSSNSILNRLVNFYFLTVCHELTHNKHSEHSLGFINDMQTIAVEFMPEKDLFLKEFALISYF